MIHLRASHCLSMSTKNQLPENPATMKPRSLRAYIRLLVLLPWLLFGAADLWHMLVDDFGQLEHWQQERMQLLEAPLVESLRGQEPMQPDERMLQTLKRDPDIRSVTVMDTSYRVI